METYDEAAIYIFYMDIYIWSLKNKLLVMPAEHTRSSAVVLLKSFKGRTAYLQFKYIVHFNTMKEPRINILVIYICRNVYV